MLCNALLDSMVFSSCSQVFALKPDYTHQHLSQAQLPVYSATQVPAHVQILGATQPLSLL